VTSALIAPVTRGGHVEIRATDRDYTGWFLVCMMF